ncbi:MAG: tRNA dihydrouridine synthase DusB [Flavobacteriales bacterium]|nr:tRNA dihydrouridine synthase DusB [Flavobacteriales bacterium]
MKIDDIELGKYPLFLAPMEDVTDPPFRRLCKQFGVDMLYTEFISSEGLIRDAVKSKEKLDIFDYERPVAIQIFGADADVMAQTARIVETAKPDIIDINWGCPVKKVVAKGAGSAILKDIPKMVEVTKAVIEATNLPVTVKTRLGWDAHNIVINEVAERMQEIGVKALAVHGRTRVQMYKGEANWEPIAKLKENPNLEIPIIVNGDIDTPEIAKMMFDEYKLDGVMIGRAAIGNPWIFREVKHFIETGEHHAQPTMTERVNAARNLLEWEIAWKGEILGVREMRRHYTNYFKGLPNIKEHRMKLVTEDNPENIYRELDVILDKYIDFFK